MGQSVVVKNRTTALWPANSAGVCSAPAVSRSWKDRGAPKTVAAQRHNDAASLISTYDEPIESPWRAHSCVQHSHSLETSCFVGQPILAAAGLQPALFV